MDASLAFYKGVPTFKSFAKPIIITALKKKYEFLSLKLKY